MESKFEQNVITKLVLSMCVEGVGQKWSNFDISQIERRLGASLCCPICPKIVLPQKMLSPPCQLKYDSCYYAGR